MKKIKGNKEKDEFRKSKEWRDFRKRLIAERGTYCQCCGKCTRLLQCHHIDASDYKNLDPRKFALVCAQCHRCISDIERIKPENRNKLRSPEYLACFGRFLIAKSKS